MSDSAKNTIEGEKLSLALNEIFSNPQMLSAISSMAQGLKGNSSAVPSVEEDKEARANPESAQTAGASAIAERLPELINMLSQGGAGIKQSHRSELLCALKPYLSQNRSDAIDKIIRFSELSSVFKNLS